MKFTKFQRKMISLVVLTTFVALLHFWATPISATSVRDTDQMGVQKDQSNEPSCIEKQGNADAALKKQNKFPWLIVGLGVVAVGAILYFMVLKKTKYNLNVNLGAGCTGTPAATAEYKKGTNVAYNYSPQPGYGNLQVKLDGVNAPASGTVTMDKIHTLDISAEVLDIRGKWSLRSVYNYGETVTSTITFSGQLQSGTLVENYEGILFSGTYTVSGESVFWEYNTAIDEFTGKFITSNTMSGTFKASSYYSGTWTATRISTTNTTGIPVNTQSVPVNGIKGTRRDMKK